jgi:hypothetical protein
MRSNLRTPQAIARAYGLLVITLQGTASRPSPGSSTAASSPTSGSPGRFTNEEIEWEAIDVGV